MMGRFAEETLLPLSGLQHFAFCPRQWALIHIERQWSENVRTIEGRFLHERVHSGSCSERDGDVIIARSVPLVSYRLGLYGVADLVEYHPTKLGGITLPNREGLWSPHPVEYKRGSPKKDDRDEVQLCAQAMCLEEMLGTYIPTGSFFYGQTRRRVRVTFSDNLRERVIQLARQMHEVFDQGMTPPAPHGVSCNLCSLKDLCIPKLTRRVWSVKNYMKDQLDLD